MPHRNSATRIGEVRDYQFREHHVTPQGEVHVSNVARVKIYSLEPRGSAILHPLVVDTSSTIAEKIRNNEIPPRIGVGFAILSPGVLNVSMWGGKYPSLLTPHLYEFSTERDFRSNLKKRDPSEIGAYCAWEAEIVGHEAHAWRRYLASAHEESDLLKYLEDMFEGEIKIGTHHKR